MPATLCILQLSNFLFLTIYPVERQMFALELRRSRLKLIFDLLLSGKQHALPGRRRRRIPIESRSHLVRGCQ